MLYSTVFLFPVTLHYHLSKQQGSLIKAVGWGVLECFADKLNFSSSRKLAVGVAV